MPSSATSRSRRRRSSSDSWTRPRSTAWSIPPRWSSRTLPTRRPEKVGYSPGTMLLPTLLSLIAGSADAIGFIGLGGLFTAHVTGNLVVLAAHVVAGENASVATMLSVPVFVVVLGLTRLLAGGRGSGPAASPRPPPPAQFPSVSTVYALCA